MIVQKVALPGYRLCFDIGLTDTSIGLNIFNGHIVDVNRAIAGYSVVKRPRRSGIYPGEGESVAIPRSDEIKRVKAHVVNGADATQIVTRVGD